MNRFTWAFLVLLAGSVVWGAEGTTTVEVKDGTVVVKSSSGGASAQAGDTVVVNGQNVVKVNASGDPSVRSSSYSRITINGKTIEVSGDAGNVNVSNQNGQITIRCGEVTLTGDTSTLKAGEKTYDISKSDSVKITVKGGQVEVDAK